MAGWRAFKKEKNRSRYTVSGRDHLGIKRQMPAFTREDLSVELARQIQTLVEYKRHNMPLPPLLAAWVEGLAPDIKTRLCQMGLLGAQARPVREHLADYETALRAKGNTPAYVRQTVYRIRQIIEGCRLTYWSDLQASAVQQCISQLKAGRELRASAQTQNSYLRDFKSFCRCRRRRCAMTAAMSAGP